VTEKATYERVTEYAEKQLPRYVQDLRAIIQQPSISATGEGMTEAAEAVMAHLEGIGLNVRLLDSAGYPAIYGELDVGAERTILVYGHYDVQPPDPLDEWIYPPFSAHQEGDRIYGRGTVDDKGNFYCAVKAIQSYLEAGETLPVNIKLIIEGEEETGSPSLAQTVRDNIELLHADALIGMDGPTYPDGRSEMIVGMKGMLFVELIAHGPGHDLHSGKASVVQNPAWRLLWALNDLKGSDGRVNLPGFYEEAKGPTEEQLELMTSAGPSDEMVRQDTGVQQFIDGLSGLDLLTRMFFEPTCNISGLTAGYQGMGSKTVLPGSASAKLDFRLVPDQDPETILQSLKDFLKNKGYDEIEVVSKGGLPAGVTDANSKIVQASLRTLTEVYGKKPVVKPQVESSGPGYIFSDILELPWSIMRFGPAENRMHAPNEYTTVEAYARGIRSIIRLLWEYAN